MARKLVFSLFFFLFMVILATCSMVKEQEPPSPTRDPMGTMAAEAMAKPSFAPGFMQ